MKTKVIPLLFLLRVAVFAGQPQPGDLLWSYDFGETLSGSPIISSWCPTLAPDGTVYVGRLAGLFAITNNGITASAKWILTNITQATAPALGSDGTIYVYDNAGAAFYALN